MRHWWIILIAALCLGACDNADDESSPAASSSPIITAEITEAAQPTNPPTNTPEILATTEPLATAEIFIEASSEPSLLMTAEVAGLSAATSIEPTAAAEISADVAATREPNPYGDTVMGVIMDNEVFSRLVAALETVGMVELLAGIEEYTLFAPINRAFTPLEADQIDAAMQVHIVPGKITLEDGQVLETIGGETLTVRVTGKQVFINNARVLISNIEASNGVIYMINQVIEPE